MTDYHHGVSVQELIGGGPIFMAPATSNIGVIVTAPDADSAVFPLNRPVLVTNFPDAIGSAGESGTLPIVLEAIQKQATPFTIVIRVEEGSTDEEMTSNVIGGFENGTRTGAQALLSAKSHTNIVPKILAAPGLDSLPVAQELVSIAMKLDAFAYVSASGAETMEQAVAYRNNFGAREVMVIWPSFESGKTQNDWEHRVFTIATACGLRAKIDQEIGFHKTLSNVPAQGITGINKDVYFHLTQKSTDANYLNSNEVTTLINKKGFRFWGSRTCSAEPQYAFESATRTAQFLKVMVSESNFPHVGKPMYKSMGTDFVNALQAVLNNMTNRGLLLGGEAWVDTSINTKESIAKGQFSIDYDFSPAPPLENLEFRQRITDKYLLRIAQ